MDQWKSEQIGELMAAVAKAQAKLHPAKKDADNPFFKSKYADLPAVWDALVPFREEGIAIVQCPAEADAGHIAIETTLAHASGQWIRSRLVMPLAKNDPQVAGSAITYGRRYALGCMTGLVTEEDDDGNAASHAPQASAPRAPMTHKQTAQAKINELRQEMAATPKQAPAPPSDQPFIWQVGKHKGTPIADLPIDYLAWAAQSMTLADHKQAAEEEILRREQALQGSGVVSENEEVSFFNAVADAEDFLSSTEHGANILRSIRNGFELADGQYPMLAEQRTEYLNTLQLSCKRVEKK